jgi:hypothetical protein
LDSSSGAYTATITAPGTTSYNQTGGYYDVTVEATNTAGTVATANASTMDSLKLVVKENVPPVITVLSPTDGAYVTNSKQPIVFTVTDEQGGSGVDPDSVNVDLLGYDSYYADDIVSTAIDNGYSFTCTPGYALADGEQGVRIHCLDNDGNLAGVALSFTIDTVPPTLSVTAPATDLITNSATLRVQGSTNDTTSSPVVVTVQLENSAGVERYTMYPNGSGNFVSDFSLAEGTNKLTITATDAAGKSTSITRTVTLDTTTPVIKSATITPNPVDAGATMIITVVIEET